ncbi:RNA-directed DNA polymerase, eukaryota, reverse transcriptase zinc-binding domain protein [Tanacetum coccineum]
MDLRKFVARGSVFQMGWPSIYRGQKMTIAGGGPGVFRVFVDLVMDQKRVEGDELLCGVANRMNKLSGKGEVATKHQRVAARVLNPRSSIDQHGMNNDGVQPRFDSRARLDAVLEGGPWMIRNSPIILKKWSVNTSLQKEEMTRIPIWVKLHDVPIQVFEEDGISLIASKSWINSEAEFMESITIGIPELEGPDSCPKNLVNTLVVNNSTNTNTLNDGFQQVANKRRNNKKNAAGNTIPRGVLVAKGFQVGKQFNYQPKAPKTNSDGGSTREATSSKVGSSSYSNKGASHKVTSIDKQNDKDILDTGAMTISNISSLNPFIVLGEVEDEDEDIENVYDESRNLNLNHNLGASTPAQTVHDVIIRLSWNNMGFEQIQKAKKGFDRKVYSRWKWTSNGSLCDKGLMRNRPWVLLGDFNAALYIEDLSSGGYEPNVAMRDFKECVQAMEVADVNSTWIYFTWNQKPKGSNGILKKIDKIMEASLNEDVLKQKAKELILRHPLHIYWASVFILPSRIVHDLEQLMRGFLWCQGEMKKGKAKVAWDSVCMPKHEGGLGIRRIEDFNIALMATHIWSIFTHRESLWVKWVHTYKLKGRSFWDVPCRGDASWGWRKLLQIRSTIRPFIWHKINNGKSTSVWFDRWTDVCPLKDLLSNWDIMRSGFSLENSLVIQQKLKTQDRLWQWDVGPSMDAIPPHLSDVVAFIVPLSKGKTVVSIISRIVVAPTSYYIWLERNGRLFKKKTSTPGQIVDVIFSTLEVNVCCTGLHEIAMAN